MPLYALFTPSLLRYSQRCIKSLVVCALIVNVTACKEDAVIEKQHVAELFAQHAQLVDGDHCSALKNKNGDSVSTPDGFSITPYQAIKKAQSELGFVCHHKWGAEILADKDNYYIVRGGVVGDAIVINGRSAEIVSAGFQAKP